MALRCAKSDLIDADRRHYQRADRLRRLAASLHDAIQLLQACNWFYPVLRFERRAR